MKGHHHVLVWRYVFLVAQVIAIVVVLRAVWTRSQPQPVAATDLATNHQLTRADLKLAETEPLVGRYLVAPVIAGSPITLDVLSTRAPASMLVSTIAAVVKLDPAEAKARGISVGTAVVVRKTLAPTLEVAGTVVGRQCDDTNCVFFVALPKLPPGLEPDAFSSADIAAVSSPKGK